MDGKNGLSGMLSGECSQYTTTTNKAGIDLRSYDADSILKIYQLKREYKFYLLTVISLVFSSK